MAPFPSLLLLMIVSENITLFGHIVITKTTRGAVITPDIGETVSPHLLRRGKGAHTFLSPQNKKEGKSGKGGLGEVRFQHLSPIPNWESRASL